MKKILICDDSPAEIKVIESVLQTGGYWPVAITDATLIESVIERERPLVILLDVVMPQRNGFQVWRDLKAKAEFNRIPVIVVSSKNGESDKFWAQQQGADAYVVKPFTAQDLLSAVQRFA